MDESFHVPGEILIGHGPLFDFHDGICAQGQHVHRCTAGSDSINHSIDPTRQVISPGPQPRCHGKRTSEQCQTLQ